MDTCKNVFTIELVFSLSDFDELKSVYKVFNIRFVNLKNGKLSAEELC